MVTAAIRQTPEKNHAPDTLEMAKLSGIAYRTMQDIEQERSDGSVQTMTRIFGMLGLKLTVTAIARPVKGFDE